MNQEQQQQGDFEASQNHTQIQHVPTNSIQYLPAYKNLYLRTC